MKATQATLDKIEDIFKLQQYKVRYEKGNFKPGSCLILDNKVVVVNKFATLDVKISALAEILSSVELDEGLLSEAQLKFLDQLKTVKVGE